MMIRLGYCACGQPLHYTDDAVRAWVNTLTPFVRVTSPDGSYYVQRHYLALHGLKSVDLERLADAGVIERRPRPRETSDA